MASTGAGELTILLVSLGELSEGDEFTPALIAELERRKLRVVQTTVADAEDAVETHNPHVVVLCGTRGAQVISTLLDDGLQGTRPRLVVTAPRAELSKLQGLNRNVVAGLLASDLGERLVVERLQTLARQAAQLRQGGFRTPSAPRVEVISMPPSSPEFFAGVESDIFDPLFPSKSPTPPATSTAPQTSATTSPAEAKAQESKVPAEKITAPKPSVEKSAADKLAADKLAADKPGAGSPAAPQATTTQATPQDPKAAGQAAASSPKVAPAPGPLGPSLTPRAPQVTPRAPQVAETSLRPNRPGGATQQSATAQEPPNRKLTPRAFPSKPSPAVSPGRTEPKREAAPAPSLAAAPAATRKEPTTRSVFSPRTPVTASRAAGKPALFGARPSDPQKTDVTSPLAGGTATGGTAAGGTAAGGTAVGGAAAGGTAVGGTAAGSAAAGGALDEAKSSVESAAPPDSRPAESQPVPSEPVHSEPVHSEPVHSEPAMQVSDGELVPDDIEDLSDLAVSTSSVPAPAQTPPPLPVVSTTTTPQAPAVAPPTSAAEDGEKAEDPAAEGEDPASAAALLHGSASHLSEGTSTDGTSSEGTSSTGTSSDATTPDAASAADTSDMEGRDATSRDGAREGAAPLGAVGEAPSHRGATATGAAGPAPATSTEGALELDSKASARSGREKGSGKKVVWGLLVAAAAAAGVYATLPRGGSPRLQGASAQESSSATAATPPNESAAAEESTPATPSEPSTESAGSEPSAAASAPTTVDPFLVEEAEVVGCAALLTDFKPTMVDPVQEASLAWKEAREQIVKGDLKAVERKMCEAVQLHDQSAALEGLAMLYVTQRAPRRALTYLERAEAIRPNETETINLRGDIHSQLGEQEQALAAWLRALKLDPSETVRRRAAANDFATQGQGHFRRGALPQAERWFRRAVALDPENVVALNGLAETFLKTSRAAQAEVLARRSLDANQLNPQAHVLLGDVARAAGDDERARASYERALAIRSDHWPAKARLRELTAQKK